MTAPPWMDELFVAADFHWRSGPVCVLISGGDAGAVHWALGRALKNRRVEHVSLGSALLDAPSWKSTTEAYVEAVSAASARLGTHYSSMKTELDGKTPELNIENRQTLSILVLDRVHEVASGDSCDDCIALALADAIDQNLDVIIVCADQRPHALWKSLSDVHICADIAADACQREFIVRELFSAHRGKSLLSGECEPDCKNIAEISAGMTFDDIASAVADHIASGEVLSKCFANYKNIYCNFNGEVAIDSAAWSDIIGHKSHVAMLHRVLDEALFEHRAPPIDPPFGDSSGALLPPPTASKSAKCKYTPTGVILHGPPGTGKTTIARAAATHVAAHGGRVVVARLHDVIHGTVGDTERALRAVFETAARSAPALIFFDELDAFVGLRRSGCSEDICSAPDAYAGTAASLLAEEMDCVFGEYASALGSPTFLRKESEEPCKNLPTVLHDENPEGSHATFADIAERPRVLVLAATNIIDAIPSPLLRHGRFDVLMAIT